MALGNNDGVININVYIDTKKAKQSIDTFTKDTEKGFDKINKTLTDVGKTLTAAFSARELVKFSSKCLELASDLTEVENVVDKAFGNMRYKVEDFAKSAIKNYGMTETEAKRAASTFAIMGQSMGLSQEVSTDIAVNATKRMADVASQYNMTISEVETMFKSIWTGETESLKRIGVVMTQTNLKNFALTKGITKQYNELSQAEKVMLQYEYVLEATKTAQDDYMNTSEGYANTLKSLKGSISELQATIGQEIEAPMAEILGVINDAIITLSQNEVLLDVIIAGLGSLTAAIIGVTLAQAALNFIMSANPIVLIIGAVVALVGVLITLWNKCDGFRQFLRTMFTFILKGIDGVINFFLIGINNIIKGINVVRKAFGQAEIGMLKSNLAGAYADYVANDEARRAEEKTTGIDTENMKYNKETAQNTQQVSQSSQDTAEEIKKSLASFDEISILSDNSKETKAINDVGDDVNGLGNNIDNTTSEVGKTTIAIKDGIGSVVRTMELNAKGEKELVNQLIAVADISNGAIQEFKAEQSKLDKNKTNAILPEVTSWGNSLMPGASSLKNASGGAGEAWLGGLTKIANDQKVTVEVVGTGQLGEAIANSVKVSNQRQGNSFGNSLFSMSK